GGELDAGHHGRQQYAHGDVGHTLGQPGDLHGHRHGRSGGDDCGEQSDQPDGDGGHGGQYAAVGDREGRERESGGAGGGDVRGGARERDDHRRQPDDQRERGGDGGELDAERDGGHQHAHGHGNRLERPPLNVRCHVHGAAGG